MSQMQLIAQRANHPVTKPDQNDICPNLPNDNTNRESWFIGALVYVPAILHQPHFRRFLPKLMGATGELKSLSRLSLNLPSS